MGRAARCHLLTVTEMLTEWPQSAPSSPALTCPLTLTFKISPPQGSPSQAIRSTRNACFPKAKCQAPFPGWEAQAAGRSGVTVATEPRVGVPFPPAQPGGAGRLPPRLRGMG